MTLPGAVNDAAGQPGTVRVGTIVTVNPARVDIQGTVYQDAGVLQGYLPQVGDRVAVLGQAVKGSGSSGSSWLILGRVENAAALPLEVGRPVARLRRNSTALVPNNTAIPWDEETFDDLGGHDLVTNPTRYTPPVPGRFIVTCVSRMPPGVSESAVGSAAIRFNGVTTTASVTSRYNISPSAGLGHTVSDCIVFNGTTDYVEIVFGHNMAPPNDLNVAGSVLVITYGGPS